jgi:hypothetical protein
MRTCGKNSIVVDRLFVDDHDIGSTEEYLMRTLLLISVVSLVLAGCGGSNSTRSSGVAQGGDGGSEVVTSGTGGATGGTEDTGGSGGTEPTGGTGGDVATGGAATGGQAGEPVATGGQAGESVVTGGQAGESVVTGGGAGEPATGGQAGNSTGGQAGDNTGGTGNVGGGCTQWDCTNIAINLAGGWDPASGEPVPEACGLVQDPCTGMMIDCGNECSQPFQTCGGDVFNDLALAARSPEQEIVPGPSNLCNGQCVWSQDECSTPNINTNLVYCSNYLQPNSTCEGEYFYWCCDELPPLTEIE